MKRGFSLVELLVVVAIIAILASLLLPALARTMESARRTICVNNLNQLGLSLRMYADEHSGDWPLRAVRYFGQYRPDAQLNSFLDGVSIYPEYLDDHRVILCPSDSEYTHWLSLDAMTRPVHPSWHSVPNTPVTEKDRYVHFADYSYVYWGFLVPPDLVADLPGMLAVGSALDNQPCVGCVTYATREADLEVTFPDTGAVETLPRLKDGCERFLISDINNPEADKHGTSGIPIIWDTVRTQNGRPYANEVNHLPLAAHVLFMDGHVEWVRYPQPNGSTCWMLSPVAAEASFRAFP